ncbi:helix-turn-helix domain-containing protein [Kitasatospora sp. NPDC089509]|uniref:helix-turn-helix domain-containing protein n=1 Tax=Kitasatospora sp. NPDC089509 TaxID=3364079 RepID=UPI00381B130D
MPSLERLIEMDEFGLTEFPGTQPRTLERAITAVWPACPNDRARVRNSLTETLAIADLDDWAPVDTGFERLVSRTAGAGAAALAIVSTTGHVPAELVNAMAHLRVPLLTIPARTSWVDVADAVTRERMDSLRQAIEWRDRLLGHARVASDARHAGRIVRWLASETSGRAVLIGRDGALIAAAPQRSADGLTAVADKIAQVAVGALESAAFEYDGREIRLVAVGSSRPRAVLAVARQAPFDRGLTQITNRAADLISLHLAVEDADTAVHNHQATAIALRVAILQLLMTGEVFKAQRTSASLYPGLLDRDTARVYILESRPLERAQLDEECRRILAGRAIVVQCPVYDEHLIIVAPRSCPAEAGDDEVGAALCRLVAGQRHRYLGGSSIKPLTETGQSYRHALRALANAKLASGRSALYNEQGRLPELLNQLHPGWASAVLHPLLGQRAADRDVLIQALNLTLQSSVRATAELTGAHRNTVANRVRSAAGILGVDLDSLRDRALTAVALEALIADGHAGETAHVGPADLREYLASSDVRAWRDEFLRPLSQELACTLKEWVVANGDTARTAQALGIHTQTARKRLRQATKHLQRDLLNQSADAYDVVLAISSRYNLPLPLPCS